MPITISKRGLLKWGAWLLLAASFALLSFYQIIRYQKWFILFTVLLAFGIAVYFLKKTSKDNFAYVKEHPAVSAAIALGALVLVAAMYQAKGVPNIGMTFEPLPFRFFRFRWWMLSAPALWYLLVWVWRKAGGFLLDFWNGLDRTDRRIYLAATVVSSAVILLLYSTNSKWYLQYDAVYSIDSGWCYQSIFPQLTYYDIRHPALSIVTFPIWAAIRFVLQLFAPAQLLDTLCASCIQIVNVQFLLLIGFLIGKLSGSRWVTLLYLASSPVLLFTVFFEKYQLCTFLLVLYACQLCRKEKNAQTNLILATGTMPTSVFLFADELLVREPFVAKLKRCGRTAAHGVMFLIGTGRIHLLNPSTLLDEVSSMARSFGLQDLSVKECLFSYTKMVQGSFLGLSSSSESRYFWTDILSGVSIIGIVLFAVGVIGIIAGRRERFVRICAIWTVCSLLLLVVFQWSVQESPLFSLYFSWALIPLFHKGLLAVISRLHWKEQVVYPVLLIPLFAINVLNLIDIGIFLK